MKKALISALGCAILFVFTSFQDKEEWTNLLDNDLSNWSTYQSYRHTITYNGKEPVDEKGDIISPIGAGKNEANVFSAVQENGETVLKISGEIYGCLISKKDYENYHLKLQVKWGSKIWEPRKKKLKDSGICYHSIGKNGADYWRSWMLSQEFQIMEGHIGDYWNIANAAIDIKAFIPEGVMSSIASEKQPFIGIGTGSGNPGFCMRSADYESPVEDWTTVELICFEDKSLHIVNGHVVMILQNSRYVVDGKSVPLVKGKIQLQSEAAEVFYKDIQIKDIPSMPAAYAGYFK